MIPTVVLASRNRGKIEELAVLLKPFGVTVMGLDAFPAVGEVEETGVTFAENALLKATTVSSLTGHIAIADDSGLVVDALGGEPGVYSARYSEERDFPATDERNIEKVLANAKDVPDGKRAARFVCVMAAAAPDGRHILAEGRWEGVLARERAGANGFGYDPVFFDPEEGMTAAQMEPARKNERSHRAAACRALLEQWPVFWQRLSVP